MIESGFTDFVAALPDGSLVVDRAGVVVAANAGAADALGLEPLRLPLTSVVRSRAVVEAVAAGKAATAGFEIHGRVPRQFSVWVSPLGAAGHVLLMFRDLTREQRIEDMRSDFVANASHEMRTPLASIIGAIETLQGAAKSDAKAREMFLGTMMTQAQRMKRLIDDLLTLSRIELDEHVLPSARVDLAKIAAQACANLASQAKAAGVEVSCDGDPSVPVRGNADELMQVALNLIENAIKYGSSGKRVAVNCAAAGGRAVLSVEDHGPGIAAEHIPRLTERFYRVNTQESRAKGGTGLGLAIVKHIVSRHRGQLGIESRPGTGSVFEISIPLLISIV